MAYKISVVIPCYKARETIAKALHSIAMQSMANEVEVVIVNDADHIYYDDIIRQFPDLDISYYLNEVNKGCGGARNTGIKNAQAEYICFLDADDQFTNSLALEIMYNRIKAEQADMLISVFESEMRCADGVAIRKMEQAVTWCHGKMYRKQYLLDNNLYFKENLRINEDAEFHQILVDLGAKIVEIPMATLMWRDNPKSVTHESLYRNKRVFVDAATEYLRDCAERGLAGDKVTLRVLQNIVVIYQYFNIVLDDTPENEEDYLSACREYWKLCEPIVANVDDDYITKVYCGIMKNFEIIPEISFKEFLGKIRS